MQFDKDKFKNLIHYVIWKAGGNDGFGATKLNKVLWFAEARAYVLRRQPIAGATYIRDIHGPVPRLGRQVRAELVAEGLISERKVNRGRYEEWIFQSLSPPQKFLSDEDKQDVDYWIKHIDEDHTATSISEESHDYGWEIARQGEEIPLIAILAQRIRTPTKTEIEKAKSKAKDLGYQ